MGCNEHGRQSGREFGCGFIRPALLAVGLAVCLAGCSVTGNRESPLNEVTRDSPTVLDVYRNQAALDGQADRLRGSELGEMRAQLHGAAPRPVAAGDEQTQRY